MNFEDLDKQEIRQRLDVKNVYGSTGLLTEQCAYIWELAKTLEFPESYRSVENITLCGMGGSTYGGYIVKNLYWDQLKIPLIEYGDYHLPAYFNGKSLLILSSYSGGTEEVLSSAEEAVKKGSSIVGLTGGGKVRELSQTHNFPALVFDQKYNPSGQPRLGTGYMIFGVIAILARLGIVQVTDDEVNQAIAELRENQEAIKLKAKEAAKKLHGSIPVVFAAEFLQGNIHIMRNQINETAKSFAAFSPLPELNHHLMEGLKNPPAKNLYILFIDSAFYSNKLQNRVEITKDVVEKNSIPYLSYQGEGSTKLSQMLNVLSFGGYVSLYLAFLYDQDPSVIPWVDYFKDQMAKTG